VPEEVIVRAREILNNLEKGEFDEVGMPKIARGRRSAPKDRAQLSLFVDGKDMIASELKSLDIPNMTPLEALQKISSWKDKL
jgi:DNA mismatch repair protein MutS